ncbi:hypothetical protein WA538_004949, partial [Blastocystis sp. DL]
MKGAKMGAYPQGLSLLDTLQRLLFGFSFNRAMNCDHDNTIRTIAKNVLTDAFRDDPILCALVRQDDKAEYALQKLYDLTLPLCLERGCVHVNKEGNAATIWWLSDYNPMGTIFLMKSLLFPQEWVDVAGSWWSMGRMAYFMWATSNDHPSYKHIYVWQIGVMHSEMQHGYGSQLMREITTYADENNLPIYLESSKDVNLPFYRKHGFVVLERKQVMSAFPFYWRLLRPAKNPLLPF